MRPLPLLITYILAQRLRRDRTAVSTATLSQLSLPFPNEKKNEWGGSASFRTMSPTALSNKNVFFPQQPCHLRHWKQFHLLSYKHASLFSIVSTAQSTLVPRKQARERTKQVGALFASSAGVRFLKLQSATASTNLPREPKSKTPQVWRDTNKCDISKAICKMLVGERFFHLCAPFRNQGDTHEKKPTEFTE